MCVHGRVLAKKKGIVTKAHPCFNSWGDYIEGDRHFTDADGNIVELPKGVFLIESTVLQRMLDQGDSFLASDARGWAKRDPMDWLV